jgi:ParB family chromosome partitioning protein
MAVKRDKVHFASVDELLGAPVAEDATTEIRIDQIYPFDNHPFKVLDDEKMEDLVASVKENGVLVPVLVRPDDEGTYEMISGHRRLHAAQKAGLATIPAIIRQMTNDEATIAMVDANIQREEILPSERAFSLKMKMDAMRRQGARTDLTSGS